MREWTSLKEMRLAGEKNGSFEKNIWVWENICQSRHKLVASLPGLKEWCLQAQRLWEGKARIREEPTALLRKFLVKELVTPTIWHFYWLGKERNKEEWKFRVRRMLVPGYFRIMFGNLVISLRGSFKLLVTFFFWCT